MEGNLSQQTVKIAKEQDYDVFWDINSQSSPERAKRRESKALGRNSRKQKAFGTTPAWTWAVWPPLSPF
jgi:hypothetical protein